MSEEKKVVEPQNQTEEKTNETVVEKAKEITFTQQQLDNIIKQRLDAEKAKHQRQVDEAKKQLKKLTMLPPMALPTKRFLGLNNGRVS